MASFNQPAAGKAKLSETTKTGEDDFITFLFLSVGYDSHFALFFFLPESNFYQLYHSLPQKTIPVGLFSDSQVGLLFKHHSVPTLVGNRVPFNNNLVIPTMHNVPNHAHIRPSSCWFALWLTQGKNKTGYSVCSQLSEDARHSHEAFKGLKNTWLLGWVGGDCALREDELPLVP